MRKRIAKGLAGISLAGGLIVLLAALSLATGPGQRAALGIAGWAASSADGGIRFGTLEGSLFSNGQIDSITLLDRDGAWLEVRGLSFSWRPFALLAGRLHIESLSAEAVDVARAPAPAGKKGGGASNVPLVRLVLAHFEIAEITIAEAVAGEPVALRAEAEAHLVDAAKGLGARLAIHRLDGPGGAATAHLSYRPDTRELDLAVGATEPGDGIIARLLDLDGATLDLAFNGSGPLDAWRASWSLAASGTPFVAGNAAIDRSGAGHGFTAQFEGYLTPIAPRAAATLVSGKTTGRIVGHWADGQLEIERAELAGEALNLRASGGVDTASGAAFGEVAAHVGRADAEPLRFMAGEGEALALGHAELKLTAPKSATSRSVSAHVTASGLARGTQSLDRLVVQAVAVQEQSAVWRLADIDMRVGAAGLQRSPADDPLDLDLRITGTAAPDRLDLAFATDALTGTLDATLGPDALSVDLTARLAELSHVVPAMTGSVTLEGRLRGTPANLDMKVSIAGEDTTLHGRAVDGPSATLVGRKSPDALSGALEARADIAGQSLSAHGRLAHPSGGALTLEALAVSFGDIRIHGDLAIGENSLPTGLVTIEAPSLAALGAVLGETVDGALTASVALSDAPSGPVLAFRAESPAIRYGEMRMSALRASGRFEEHADGTTGEAELTVAGVAGGVEAKDIRLTARARGRTIDVALTGRANGAEIDLGGAISEVEAGHEVTISSATLRKDALAAVLAGPARIPLQDGEARIGSLAFTVGTGRIEISGTAGVKKLDVATRIASLPASLADAFAPDAGLGGLIDGRIDITGTPDAPRATAHATWRNASARATRDALPPLTVEVSAKLADNRVDGRIETRGPDNLTLAAAGAIDLSPGGPLTATLTGDIPLALANATLADRATRLAGRARLSGHVGGTLAAPSVSAAIEIADATLRDPESGLTLKPLNARLGLTEQGAVIERLEATSERGGTLSGTGEVTLGHDGAPPVLRLALDVSALRFDDRRLMAGELDGRFEIRGTPEDLAASGAIRLTRLDVTVPNALPRSISELDIRHVNAPAHLAAPEKERAAARPDDAGGHKIALDIHLQAANRIFVQGRGLDVQLGGALRLGGTAAHPVANGAFAMERGRLAILGRQLDFRRGNINFYGSLEPLLDMEAAAQAGDVTVIVTVTGSSADPKFAFSSTPALPEDEVVARLLYNKDLAGLSPLQLAQLASEIDKIGGLSSGPGVLDQLKASVGIDVLDIGTDSQGAATVSAGSYVSESTYVGVRQGTAAGSSQVVIDHDLTRNLKARGELGADGQSKIGIGFEWDY